MGFSKSIYDKALEEKRILRQHNEALKEQLKEKLYREKPRVKEIDEELSKMGIELTMAAFSGKSELLKQLENKADRLQNEKKEYLTDEYTLKYQCEKCSDTGYVDGKLCECIHKAAKAIQFAALSSVAPFEKCTFETFDLEYYPNEGSSKIPPRLRMEKNFNFVKKFVYNFPCGQNLLLVGGAGLGKTHISVAIGNELINKGFGVFYCSSDYIITKLVSEKFSKNGGEENYSEAVRECDLFILDDLGCELPTQMVASEVYDIINSRLLTGKSTVINTNLTMEEIAKRYSPRVSSRLIGEYTTLLFDGTDIRQIKKMKK